MLNRIGELSQTQQIRIADNLTRMRDLEGLRFDPASGGWVDATGADRNAHDLAQPLTGAIFDILVEIFQDRLVARGIIPPDVDARGWERGEVEAAMALFEAHWGQAFVRFEPVFREALLEARDVVGRAIALVLDRLEADDLTFTRVASLFLEASLKLGQGHHFAAIRQHFLDRDIAAELPALAAVRPARFCAPPRRLAASAGPCLAERVGAMRRARRLAVDARIAARREERRTLAIERLLRRDHREADRLADD
jgi:hypothetical protein